MVDFLDSSFRSGTWNWTLENPGGGSAEINLRWDQLASGWASPKRLVIRGERDWGGEVSRIEHGGDPNDEKVEWTVSGLGFVESRLNYRIVRHDFVVNDTAAIIVEALLSEAQDNQFNGTMGFSMGDVIGTTVTRLRRYCVGVNVGDAIRELSSIARGFSWEVDADGRINIWNNTRGIDTGRVLTREMCEDFHVTLDTSELLTNVTAIASATDPYGPKYRMSRTAMADNYGRREVAIDTDIIALNQKNPDWEQELYDAGRALLKVQGGGILNLHTKWNSSIAPWSMADVWLEDSVTVQFSDEDADIFGASVDMRVTMVTVTVEPMPPHNGGPPIYWIEYDFDAVIRDLDIEDGDPDQEGS